jgi:hypothetical protein
MKGIIGMIRRVILFFLKWQVRRYAKAWALHDVRDTVGLTKQRNRYARATGRLVRYERRLGL